MKKVAIVYTSKFGHTKQYADWLLEHLGKDDADIINVATFNPTQLLAYKLIIFASGVYGDKMPIMDFVKKNIMGISSAKTMFLAVSWYTNDSEDGKQKLIEENYPEQLKGKVPLYVVNSGIDKKKISVADKAKLLASQVMIEKNTDRSNDDINILAIMKGYSDPTAAENLDSIKKAIEEYFNPPKKEEPKPAPRVEAAPAPKPASPAPVPEVKPEPKPESVPNPMAASEMTSDADALSSLENAFKALKASKPESKPEPKPEPAPKPMDASEMTSDADALASLENAFKALGAPKSAPAVEPKPEPVVEVKPEPVVEVKPEPVVEVKPEPVVEVKPEPVVEVKPEPVVEVKSEPVVEVKPEPVVEVKPESVVAAKPEPQKPTPTQKEVVSSVKSAIRAMSNGSLNTNYAPAPTFNETKSEASKVNLDFGIDEKTVAESAAISSIGNIDLSAEPGISWDSVVEDVKSEPVVEVKPEPVVEVKPEPVAVKSEPAADSPAPKNSYMELFAKRRRKSAEEAAEAKQEPVVESRPEPIVEVKPEPVVEVKPEPVIEAKPEPVAEVKPEPVTVKPVKIEKPAQTEHASSVDVLSEFDFISGTAPAAPVAPAAPAAPAPVVETTAVDMDVYDFMSSDAPKASSRALNAVQDLAKAKAKAEEEAAKKAAEEAAAAPAPTPASDNSFIEQMKRDMAALAEESQHELEIGSVSMNEDDSEEIDGFTFSNNLDYDLSEIEIDTPAIGEISFETIHKFEDDTPKQSNADFDFKKLQEEINASIETNKANKEKMMSRHARKPKEEVHNPFAVQFEEDESKSKKKKKGPEIGAKRLEDPLDPDVFFSRPTKKNPDWNMPSETMPEIKFRNR